MRNSQLSGKVVFNKYLVGSCIGCGSFGQVYLVYDIEEQEIYAMKAVIHSFIKEEEKTKNPQLLGEARIIKQLTGDRGFVKFHHYGYESKYNILVMGLLGPSLQDLFNSCSRSFSLKTVLMLAQQMITRIQALHTKNFVYRDIKPQNFLMGLHENSHLVHLIDFGLSKKFRDAKNHQHVPYRQNRSIVGTVRYCSINSHLGLEYSRRDDLESLGYIFQYFYKGQLPWQGIHANTSMQKYNKILQFKQNISIDHQFMGMPTQFATYMHYCRSLKFSERPDYSFLRKLFSDLMEKLNFSKDYVYDWCKLEHSVIFENGTMSLAIRNHHSDLQSPYFTLMSGEIDSKLDLNDINFKIEEEEDANVVDDDEEEGNIEQDMLEDSDLKLISKRNKWFESEL